MIVAISGIDGSGKSSLASNVTAKLAAKGVKVKLIYLGDYIVVGSLVKLIHKVYRIFKPSVSNSEIANPFLSTTPKSIFNRSWLFVALFDNAIAYLTLRVYVLFGYKVVCDRYFYDKLVGFIYHGYCGPILKRIYMFFTPTADIQIILDQESSICLDRETCGKHSLAFYEQLRQLYADLRELIDCYYIDVGKRDETGVAEEVLLAINRANNSKP